MSEICDHIERQEHFGKDHYQKCLTCGKIRFHNPFEIQNPILSGFPDWSEWVDESCLKLSQRVELS